MSNGKTRFENLCLEAQAGCKKATRIYDRLIGEIDECIVADQSNDGNLTAGLQIIQGIINDCTDSRMKKRLESAHAEIRVAADKDFGDMTKERLKARVISWCESWLELEGAFVRLKEKVCK